MKKIKKLFKKFKDPIYKNEVWLLVNYTPEEYKKFLVKKKLDFDFNIKYDEGGTTKFEGGLIIVWLRRHIDYYILTHEVCHLVFYMFEFKGIPIREENSEVFCYSVEYWIKTFWREVSKI